MPTRFNTQLIQTTCPPWGMGVLHLGQWLSITGDSRTAPISQSAEIAFESIDELRTADVATLADGQRAWVDGYATRNDGGQGRFWLDKTGELEKDAADGGTVIAAGGGENWYWRRYHDGPLNAAWYGVLPGENDVLTALDNLEKHLQAGDGQPVLTIPPGTYHLSAAWEVNTYNLVFHAHGVVFDNTVWFRNKAQKVYGLEVRGSPGVGFKWSRSQGGLYVGLKASKCASHGFVLGGSDYHQVTLATLIQPFAASNDGDGFVLEGSGKKNWVNANCLVQPLSRGNKGRGFVTLGKANYNTFIMPQTESNGGISVFDQGRENTWVGGHYVSKDDEGYSFIGNSRATIFGGRMIGGVKGPITSLFFSPICPQPNRVLYSMHRISTNELTVGKSGKSYLGDRFNPLPSEYVEYSRDLAAEHTIKVDCSSLGLGAFLDIVVYGAYNHSGGFDRTFHLRLNASVVAHKSRAKWSVKPSVLAAANADIKAVTIDDKGMMTIDIATTTATINQVQVYVAP
ncbi:MAG: hypothetical protein K9N51_05855 [Candidatus Pacebacteria bacterium]|nr:hypothetical protein [Candidatus Paceibacterota bacterium]